VLRLNKLYCLLFEAYHKSLINLVKAFNIYWLKLKSIFGQQFDCWFCVEPTTLCLCHTFTIYYITANTFSPQ